MAIFKQRKTVDLTRGPSIRKIIAKNKELRIKKGKKKIL